MLKDRYLILDQNLNHIGDVSVNGRTRLISDSITHQFADPQNGNNDQYGENPSSASDSLQNIDPNASSKNFVHTGTITVLENTPDAYKLKVGNNIAYCDEQLDHWYVMHIWDTEETLLASGVHSITAQLVNLAVWDLHYRIPLAKSLNDVTATEAVKWLFSNTGWTIDDEQTTAMIGSFDFDGKSKASSLIQQVLQTYNIEMDCYVELDESYNQITDKIVKIANKINEHWQYKEAVVGKNVTAISRYNVGTAITKLYVYGAGGETIASVNNGKPYLVDDDANQKYNPSWKDGTYLEASITANTIRQPQGLLPWGRKQLKLLNHDRYSYSITCTHDYNPPLGATIRVKDMYISPVITVQARVVSKTFSKSDPSKNTAQFGEFVTVRAFTPQWLQSLTDKFQSALNSARNDVTTITPMILVPDGTDFAEPHLIKRTIVQAWENVGNVNITPFIKKDGFVWRRFNQDGSIDDTFNPRGYMQDLTEQDIGTIRAYIDNSYISDKPEILPDLYHALHSGYFIPTVQGSYHTAQYMVKLSNGNYITSHSLDSGPNKNDTCYTMWDENLNQVSSMVVTDGGHGSSFGVSEENGDIYIHGVIKNFAQPTALYQVCKFKYVGGTTISIANATSYAGFSDYIRVNYDNTNKMYGITRTDGCYQVITQDSMESGGFNDYKLSYEINMTDYGFNQSSQTFQSSCLYFPYVFWHSGDFDMHDKRKLYGVNLIHAGQEFELEYDFSQASPMYDNFKIHEPEALSVTPEKNLLVTFNKYNGLDNENRSNEVYTVPLNVRDDVKDGGVN